MRDKKTQAATLPMDDEDLPALSDSERAFVEHLQDHGGSMAEAYRATHDCSGVADDTVRKRAQRLHRTERVLAYRRALTASGIVSAAYSKDEYIKESRALAQRAEAAGNYGAAVKSKENAARAAGVLNDKPQEEIPKFRSIEELLRTVALTRGEGEALELAKAYGVNPNDVFRPAANEH